MRYMRERRGVGTDTHSWVFMLSVGVTASKDSVTPAAKPARAARGPLTVPSGSARRRLY